MEISDGPIYVPQDCHKTMPAPQCCAFLSIVDSSLNPFPVSDPDQGLLKKFMANHCGLSLYELMEGTYEYPSFTTTSDESYDDVRLLQSPLLWQMVANTYMRTLVLYPLATRVC